MVTFKKREGERGKERGRERERKEERRRKRELSLRAKELID